MASTFHGLHAITGNLSPTPISTGIESIDTDSFKLQSLLTLKGLKIFCIARPNSNDLEKRLYKVYELYSDYVMKNPFYELDMPIKCELFENSLNMYIRSQNDI